MKLFLVCLCCLFAFIKTGWSQLSPVGTLNEDRQGRCTVAERQRLTDNCFGRFGQQQWRDLKFLIRQAPLCRAEVLDCRAFGEMTRCINSQPTYTLSTVCWASLKNTLTEMLQSSDIPCQFEDLYQACRASGARDVMSWADRMQQDRTRSQNMVVSRPTPAYGIPVAPAANPLAPILLLAAMEQGGLGNLFGNALQQAFAS